MNLLPGYMKEVLDNGGPSPEQYQGLNECFSYIMQLKRDGLLSDRVIYDLAAMMGDSFSLDTMQGFSFKKPYGYSGDYEIIDRIYRYWVSPKENLRRWDYFFHWQKAPQAVRNRKELFKAMLAELDSTATEEVRVLVVGSGPCRDIYEYLISVKSTNIHFTCLDMDIRAINYARQYLAAENIDYISCSAFKYKGKGFDLIWSAGLFDYLDAKAFRFLFQRLLAALSTGGNLIVGNFCRDNPTRDYMEFGEWMLNYRSESELVDLAIAAGANPKTTNVMSEPAGVNLFVSASQH